MTMKPRKASGATTILGILLAGVTPQATLRLGAGTAPRWIVHSLSLRAFEDKPLRRVELLVLENRSNEVTVGLHIELAPGWYLYWLNPGDAGLAPEVRWALPAGCSAGKLRFPTPQKFVHSGMTTYGFTEETLILCDIRMSPPRSAADKRIISAVLNWMACQESCITGESTAQVSLSSLPSELIQKSGAVFSRFAKRYPKTISAAELTLNESRLIQSPGRWTLHIPLSGPKAGRVTDFYPYPLDDFVINHQGIALKEGRFIIPIAPSNASAVLSIVPGLFIIDGAGFEVSIPVNKQNLKP